MPCPPIVRLFLAALLIIFSSRAALGQTSLRQIASGLSLPVYATAAPGDPQRLFFVEQGSSGTASIRVMDLASGSLSTYLTLSGLSTGGERGLLGLAFHPDFLQNGHFFIYASVPGGANHRSEVRRYTAQGDPRTSNLADPSSQLPVLRFDQPFGNHNGGWIGFNPDFSGADPQYLYVAAGDGGSGGDPGNRAQDITNQPLGKMLRLDVDGDDFPADANRNYAIPPTNPFVGSDGDDEIWDYGLRNPWRNSFDRATGDLWIADVGQNIIEEINWQPAGGSGGHNYGWRVKEGTNCFDNSQAGGNPPCDSTAFTDPIYQYSHNSSALGGFSVTGGYVYRGSVAQFEGLYVFGDFVTNNIWTIDPYAHDVAQSVLNRNSMLRPDAGSVSGISSFGEDDAGELYLISRESGQAFRLDSTAGTSVWNGAQAVGNPGDGVSWSDANNWSRDGVADAAMVPRDAVEFAQSGTIDLQVNRQAGGVLFAADGVTLSGHRLQVLSGNIAVAAGISATIQSDLQAETVHASLRKLGPGRLDIQGLAEQTVVLEGVLGGTGTLRHATVLSAATMSPGQTIGRLTVEGLYRQLPGAALEMELAGTTAGTEHDQLAVGGAAALQGQLRIDAISGYSDPQTPGAVDRFELVTAGSSSGQFAQIFYNGAEVEPLGSPGPDGSFVSFAGGRLFRIASYADNGFTWEHYAALPGDANGDRSVDASDFNIWNEFKFTTGTDWLSGDFNGDGVTDVSDFNIWNRFKFSTAPRGAVPEPAAGVWWLVVLYGVFRRGGPSPWRFFAAGDSARRHG